MRSELLCTQRLSKEMRTRHYGRKEGAGTEAWPCLGWQSALLLINLLPSCVAQAALAHPQCSALVKNDSASRFHLWKRLPGLVLLLLSRGASSAVLLCREREQSAETLSLSAVKEQWRETLHKRLALLSPLRIPEINLIVNYFTGGKA